MITLIKIRFKYLSRHSCSVCLSYFFIPIFLLIYYSFLLILIKFARKENKFEEEANYITKKLFAQNLTFDKYNFSLVSNDRKDKEILQELINKDIDWFSKMNEVNNKNPIIKINNENEKYKIELIQSQENRIFDQSFIFRFNYVTQIIPNLFVKHDFKLFNEFIRFQSLFAKFLIKKKGKDFQNELSIEFGDNSYPSNEIILYFLLVIFSLFIIFQFNIACYFFCIWMIEEKEKKLIELLERQGISDKKYFFSWLLTYLVIIILPLTINILFILLLFQINIALIFILNFILFALSLYLLSYFLYICISKSQNGSIIIKLIYFTSTILGLLLINENLPLIFKFILALIPQINLILCSYSIQQLLFFENLSLKKIWILSNKIPYGKYIIMYIFEIFLYSLLSIFITKYKQSGLNFFQFLISFCKKVIRKINQKIANKSEEEKIISFEKNFQDLSPFNLQRKEQKDCLSIVNITKYFDSLKAVDNFNIDLFGNEIFCLLGHNGAGKTTLVNMISGILVPSEGDIFYKGRSIVTNKDYLFENIGICEQDNIFFEYLTVREHLEYMYGIKKSKSNNDEIKILVNKLGLEEKSNSLCSTLSGGQKRKLCIALALIGNSNIILLDEPTSGMDPISRKTLWEFLKNYQKDKIILVTTHYLEEAEYLGDRIGIMSDGQLICCGTSSFLKSKYPCGFNINLLVNSNIFTEEKKKKIIEEIKRYEPNLQIRIASKSVFSLNIQANNEHILNIFKFIEKSKVECGIEDYTVASTSLEDVFLKINNHSYLNDMKYTNKNIGGEILIPENIIEMSNFCTQFISQLKRNFIPIYRSKLILSFDYFSGLVNIFILLLILPLIINGINHLNVDLINILKYSQLYIYEDSSAIGVLEDSYAYKSSMTIKLNRISRRPYNMKNLIEMAYEDPFANVTMGCISINQIGDKWNTYVTKLNLRNLFADTMLVVSAFLKKEFEINAIILNKIEINEKIRIKNIEIEKIILFTILYIGSMNGYIFFLGGLINEKIKERKTNIKHLLYLSGSNSWSYWMAFFIIDYLKLLILSIFLTIPFFIIMASAGIYFLINFLIVNPSSIIFLYFISFFGSNVKSGLKFLLLLLIIFEILIIICLPVFWNEKVISILDIVSKNIFYLTPVTSMFSSFLHILFAFFNLFNFESKQIYDYLLESYIVQRINLFIYFLLLILMETGYLRYFFNWFKLKFCLSKHDLDFSEQKSPDEFLINNSVKNSVLLNQTNFHSNINQNIKSINDEISFRNNSNDNNMKNILFENDNQTKAKVELSSHIQNRNYSNENIDNEINICNLNQPLMEDVNDIIVNNSNENSINKITLPENNLIYDINKINTDVYKEKYMLDTRNDFTTRIEGLYKTFWLCCKKNVRAINNLNLGLEANEKFGLLGLNGSGKTTTFRAITNEILYDYGEINLFGFDTRKEFKYIRSKIGYCPQENPLFDFMKVREILEFYSKLKTCFFPIEEICKNFGLTKYLDTYCVNLSGGNKRKLTFAIAIMNRPSLLLLDEPSTGVDPDSRRYMWRNINELSNSGHRYNMILTTHSMEEAEILCDRVSWLKQGSFVCIGNPEKLKIQYSLGYKLHIKFDKQVVNQNKDIYNIKETFQSINGLIEGFNSYSNYIMNNPALESHIRALIISVSKIKSYTKRIILAQIRKDLSFELILDIIKEKKYILLSHILNLKNTDKNISEINISMESLDNILSSFI